MASPRGHRSRKRLPAARSPGKGTLRLAVVLVLLLGVNLYVFLWRGDTSIPAVMEQAAMAGKKDGQEIEAVKGPQGDGASDGDGDGDKGSDGGQADPDGDGDGDGDSEPLVPEGDTWIEGEVKPGDSMGRLLRRAEMAGPDADEVVRALADHMDFRKIRPGQKYRMRFDKKGLLMEFEFTISRTVTVRAIRDEAGKLIGSKDKTTTEVRVKEVGGRIESSLYAAVKRSGEDTRLVSFFVDVFAYDVNFFTETRKGDTFRILVEKEYAGEEFLRYKRVLAAQYSGRVGTYEALYWQAPGAKEGRYFDAAGKSVEKTLLKTPLKFSRVSSKFNPNRMHPILHKRRGHMGVDFAAPTGTPVRAAADGKISFRGWRGGAGNCVILKHDGGLQTVYMHLDKFRKGQKVGHKVKAKALIGYVGTTGMSTGPHLHFGVKKNGRYVDPLKLAPTPRSGVSRKHRKRFKAHADKMLTQLRAIALPGES